MKAFFNGLVRGNPEGWNVKAAEFVGEHSRAATKRAAAITEDFRGRISHIIVRVIIKRTPKMSRAIGKLVQKLCLQVDDNIKSGNGHDKITIK